MIDKLLKSTFIRFAMVGVVNTIVGTTIMFTAYNFLGLSYWESSAANYFLTSILSFFLNKYFTFSCKDTSFSQVLRFALNIAVCYFLAYGIAKRAMLVIMSGAGEKLRTNVAMLTGMVLFTLLNYTGQRFFAFAKKGAENEK